MLYRSLAIAAFLGFAAGGCTTPTHTELSAFLKAHEHVASGTESRIRPGDLISIRARWIREFDNEGLIVQPDGKISLRLVGDVRVAGLTARETAAKLEELISPYYRDPEVHVLLKQQPSRVFYVFGQVFRRGAQPYTGGDTVLTALATAGTTNIAWRSRVKVIRPNPNEDSVRDLTVNLNSIIEDGDTKLNVMLEPGDIVYVPPTPLGWLGLRVRELLYPVQPAEQIYQSPVDFRDTTDEFQGRPTSRVNR
jgi:polysaccharide biosynthesis/export protein